MKAILFHQHGGPEVLKYTDFPTPEPKTGEALIQLKSASLNHVDVLVRNGWPGLHLDFPHINGADGAGEVIALGEGTNRVRFGDHVVINANLGCGSCEYCLSGWDNMCRDWNLLGETVRGTYTEFVSLPERQLYILPRILVSTLPLRLLSSIRPPGILLLLVVICTPEKQCLLSAQAVE